MIAPVGPPPQYPIESVDNALKLLVRCTEKGTVGVSEASKVLGVAPSTAHRILAMLAYWGFLEQRDSRERYVLGPTMLHLARAVLTSTDLRGLARPFLEGLVERTNETVHLVVLHGANINFVDVVEGSHALRSGSRLGQVLPAHCTASGKAILSLLPEDRVRALLATTELTALTSRSKTALSAVFEDLAAARKRGYATNFGESEAHLHAVAAPVRSRDGYPLAAVTLAAPSHRLPRQQIPATAEGVVHTANAISANFV